MASHYSIEELNFILYNNRSIDGVVKNFLFEKQWNGHKLNQIDYFIGKFKRKWKGWGEIEIDTTELNVEADDIEVLPIQVKTNKFVLLEAHIQLLNDPHYYRERHWLYNRGFTDEYIARWKLGSLQYLVDTQYDYTLEALGITCHPVLETLLDTDITGGGITIPHFNDLNELENCTVRRISDNGKLKYTQAVPDLTVYGINECINSNTIYITEGIFDMFALIKENKSAVSVSSAMWSSPQLYQLLELKAEHIIIFADNDRVGLSSAAVLKDVIEKISTKNVTIVNSDVCKDASEHFLEKRLDWTNISTLNITKEMIDTKEEVKFNLVEYLKDRTFN